MIYLKSTFFSFIAVCINFFISFSALFINPNWNFSTFKFFGAGDQLSYLAIAKNFSQGEFELNEPFTETGKSYYPSFYYIFMGLIIRIFRLDPFQGWNIVGAFTQALLVILISVTLVVVTKKPWTAILGFLPLYWGVFGFSSNNDWQRKLESHATIWGSFPTMFVMNAESFAIATVTTIFLISILLSHFYQNSKPFYLILILFFIARFIVNIHIYSFIASTYFIAYSLAIYQLRSKLKFNLTLTFLLVLIATFIFLTINPFDWPGLVIMLLGVFPAAIPISYFLIEQTQIAIYSVVTFILGASFGLYQTLSGYINRDDFLTYRQASSADLGVSFINGFLGSLAMTIPANILIFYYFNKNLTYFSVLTGGLSSWIILSQNDRWGANQEPYRFRIISFIIMEIIIFPLLFDFFIRTVSYSNVESILVSIFLVGLLLVSTIDSYNFYQSNNARSIYYFDTPQNKAIKKISRNLSNELLLVDSCIDASIYKAVTGKPTAFFNIGMAWPQNYLYVNQIQESVLKGTIGPKDLSEAEVKYFLSDSSCDYLQRHLEIFGFQDLKKFSYDNGDLYLFDMGSN